MSVVLIRFTMGYRFLGGSNIIGVTYTITRFCMKNEVDLGANLVVYKGYMRCCQSLGYHNSIKGGHRGPSVFGWNITTLNPKPTEPEAPQTLNPKPRGHLAY